MPQKASTIFEVEGLLRDKLYWTIEKFSLRFDYFVFFDTEPYLADQLFIRHQVRVWFDSEFRKDGSPYVAIFCHVKKKDALRFLEALDELKKSMIICGHPNYENEISCVMEQMEDMKGTVLKHEDDPIEKAE